ncbi:AMP-binding protein, partial [Bacteroides ovatus]|uniref:AMP-binding protein n=1 Tax=Bacteroides ovatus TaxID=28116 RepID=UPI001C70A0E9
IVQVFFSLQSFENEALGEISELLTIYEGTNSVYKVAKFDLSVILNDVGDNITGVFNYATSLFNKDTICGFARVYINILQQYASRLNKSDSKSVLIRDLSLLDSSQYDELVYERNKTRSEYPADKTIVELFVEQAERTPDNIALVYEDRKLTYSQLNELSNRLAAYLQTKYKINQDDPIALCLNRSEYMLIAILGVLKSGGAYVPIDPDYPEDRIIHILSDTKAKVVLTDIRAFDKINSLCCDVSVDSVAINAPSFTVWLEENYSKMNFTSVATPKSLAYIIYTSGTTGKPKGVMIEH